WWEARLINRALITLLASLPPTCIAQQLLPPSRTSAGWSREVDSVVIRTPDQRLRVFVSSTLGELAAERRAVARAITALRLTPVCVWAGARAHPPRELYQAYLAQSDVFIGIYWQRYGQVNAGMEGSGLEAAVLLCGTEGLPRLLYVKTPAPDREPRLTELLARISLQAS